MSTSTDRVMRTLARYFEVAAEGAEDTRQVEAAARRASADPEFHDTLAQVLEADWTACPQQGSKSACTHLKDHADSGIDMIIRLPDSTGCSEEQVYALQVKVSEAAGPDPVVRNYLAQLLVTAIHLERSSFGTREARRFRSQPSARDIVAVRAAWTRLSAADVAPSTLPTYENPRETEVGGKSAPDPLRAQTAAEFMGALRKYRIWAGNPSYREIARAARPPVAASTIAAALSGTRLPTLRMVTALVTGCRGGKDDLDAFTTAWRHVHSADRLSGQQSRQPVDEPSGLNIPTEEPTGRDHISSRRARASSASAATDVALMVRRAAEGDLRAWERLVEQYARLIWSITAEFKLAESDAADVAQTTWLRLLEHIDRIEYPDRVGSWLAATARNECLRSLTAAKGAVLARDEEVLSGVVASGPEVDERNLADERDQVVRDALSSLPRRWQRLLEMLMADPPVSYAEISDELDLPVGSIGPTRGRCLARLRVMLQDPKAGADGRPGSALGDDGSHRDWQVVGELVTGRCG
jgi:RNA polymerase sigma factor (sigma-70 family)